MNDLISQVSENILLDRLSRKVLSRLVLNRWVRESMDSLLSTSPLFEPIWNRTKLNEASRRTLIPIIDASKTGNLGRFFNHSCSPNIGIQNVFTNHHDIRYPHTSFFTLRNIKAGEELCWHYGYENKMTQECHCGTNACNGYYRWLHFTLQHVSLPHFIFARQ